MLVVPPVLVAVPVPVAELLFEILFDRLLIATGAVPVRLDIPGATASQCHYLRTFSDSRAIIERARGAKSVVVVGVSFIGLEVAASLRHRGIAVHVVAPDAQRHAPRHGR